MAVRLRTSDDSECASASEDGTAIVWEMQTFARRAILTGDAGFNDIVYHLDESQLVTAGDASAICSAPYYNDHATSLMALHPLSGFWRD